MVNQHDAPLDQFDLFKRKHLRQNRDIIRVNTAQAQRIRALETNVRRLLDENLSLRTELIQIKCQKARQSQSSNLIDGARNAQRALEKVLLDVAQIKNSLDDSLQSEHERQSIDLSNVSSRGIKKAVKERRRMDLKFEEFNEERKNKQKALTSGLEAPFVGSPRVLSETDASDSEEDMDVTLDSCLSKPHKDSLSKSANNPLNRTYLKPSSREKLEVPLQTTPPPAKDNPRKRRRSELFATNKENFSVLPPETLFSPLLTNEKAQREVLAESSPPRFSLIIPAGLTRIESPNKSMNLWSTQDNAKDVFADIGLDEEGGNRRTSRARKQINYALPNLRDKMRREDPPEERSRRSVSMDRSVTPDQEPTLMENKSTKPTGKEKVTVNSHTSPVRILTKAETEDKHSKPRLSLVERQSLVNGPRRTSDNVSQKRRTSSFHKPLLPPVVPPSITDIYRFPSESPIKQSPSPVKPIHLVKCRASEDKENAAPAWSLGSGRERRKTFNATLEKLAKMTAAEMQAEKDWEVDLANQRRRQSVAL